MNEYISKMIHKPHKRHLKGTFSSRHIPQRDTSQIGLKKPLFIKIVDSIFEEIATSLLNGAKVKFPYMMGEVEINSFKQNQSIVDGKYRSNNHVDWKSTLELWSEDEEARNSKTLVRFNSSVYYKLFYNNYNAKFKNKRILRLYTSQYLKNRMKEAVLNNTINVFER